MKTNKSKGLCPKCNGPVYPSCGMFGKGGYLQHKPNHCLGRALLVQEKDVANLSAYFTNGGKVGASQVHQAAMAIADLRGCNGDCTVGGRDCCKVYARRVIRALGLRIENDNDNDAKRFANG